MATSYSRYPWLAPSREIIFGPDESGPTVEEICRVTERILKDARAKEIMMSWSFSAIGSPEKVAEALEAYPEKNWPKRPEDFSRKEFEEAQPHLLALVKLNFVEDSYAKEGASKPAIRLSASGSASSRDGKKLQSSCTATIEALYGFLG